MKDSSYRENKNKKPEKEKTLIQELISTLLYIIVITSIFLCIRLYIIALLVLREHLWNQLYKMEII